MNNKNTTLHHLVLSLEYAFLGLVTSAVIFILAEPAISLSATSATSQFTISQTVSSEVSFLTPATNVTLAPSLGGLTGGTANGSTQVVVLTNDHLGYQMTLAASSSVGMIGNFNGANNIPALVPATPSVPDFNFNTVAANAAAFAYIVEASTTADLTQIFKDNGAVCNAGAGDTVGSCWLNASTTAVGIVNRSSATTASGATTTLKFRVIISANPSPAIPDDTYVATTTLTATAN
jgi:hypothetical protein